MRLGIAGFLMSALVLAGCAGSENLLIPSNADTAPGFPYAPTNGQISRALAETDALIRKNPNAPEPYLQRARIQLDADNRLEARKDVDRALALQPSARAYILREKIRDEADIAGRREDMAAARTLEPRSLNVFSVSATVESAARDYEKALAYLDAGLAIRPDEPSLLTERGRTHASAGHREAALADFARARALISRNAAKLNDLCWAKAMTGLELASALEDCNASLSIIPASSATRDSRALVELRMGQFDRAIDDYNAALKIAPNRAASLYGRGIARIKSGHAAEGEADLAKARAISSVIDARFREYGVTP